MIDFILEITGIKQLRDICASWIVDEAQKQAEAEERLFQQNLNNLWQLPEFCLSCGAGIGKFRREGEGTCPDCDPKILENAPARG